MTIKVYNKFYKAPVTDKKEILRYARSKADNCIISNELDRIIAEYSDIFSYRLCYAVLPLSHTDSDVLIGGYSFASHTLSDHLSGFSHALLFCATVGRDADRCIARLQHVSQSAALLLNAYATERVEALCDLFCSDVAAQDKGPSLSRAPRYSPGYADISLELQRTVFDILDPECHVGVSLGDTLLMSPSKTVTAIVPLCTDITANGPF